MSHHLNALSVTAYNVEDSLTAGGGPQAAITLCIATV